MDNTTDIGKRLKETRGTTKQKDFAESLGVARTYVSNIEYGRTKPSLEFLINIATNYDVSLDWLLLGRDPVNHQPDILVNTPTETIAIEVKQTDTRIKEWIELFDCAPQEARPILLNTARAIVQSYPHHNPTKALSTSPYTGEDEQAAAISDIA